MLRLPWGKRHCIRKVSIIDLFLVSMMERVKEIEVEQVSRFSSDQELLRSPILVHHAAEGRFDDPGKGAEAA